MVWGDGAATRPLDPHMSLALHVWYALSLGAEATARDGSVSVRMVQQARAAAYDVCLQPCRASGRDGQRRRVQREADLVAVLHDWGVPPLDLVLSRPSTGCPGPGRARAGGPDPARLGARLDAGPSGRGLLC